MVIIYSFFIIHIVMVVCVRKLLSFFPEKVLKYNQFRQYSLPACTMENPIVNTKNGKIRGSTQKLFDGTDYYSFQGIPYAQPPLGILRFKAPLPLKPWEGIYDALKHGSVCPQLDVQTRQIIEGSEDCLFLNVYSKSLEPNTKRPVMVFIHGGGFMSGSGNTDLYGPEFLIQHDVVLVTINYRLEIFGFLCLDLPEVPGNAGMKDQVFALRWVQNNIHNFGGDSSNVTIFGESAGGASVTYHMVSPMSKGLFHKAIAQSGVCTSDWAKAVDSKNRAFRVCKVLGKETSDPLEALEFLQTLPAVDLVAKTLKTMTRDEKNRGLPIHFAPNIEQNFANNEVFLPESPEKVLMNGKMEKLPLLIGYNSKEGIILIGTELKKLNFRNKNPSSFVSREIFNKVNEVKLKEIGERIKEFYFGGKDLTENDMEKICDLQSDLYFTYPIHLFTQMYARYSQPIYMYRFNYDTELNFFKCLLGLNNIHGASHADELFYIFCSAVNKDYYQENEKLRHIINEVTKLWTDFAKTGNPTSNSTIKWHPYSSKDKEYLSIDEDMALNKYADQSRVEFWNKIYKETGLIHINKSNL